MTTAYRFCIIYSPVSPGIGTFVMLKPLQRPTSLLISHRLLTFASDTTLVPVLLIVWLQRSSLGNVYT